MKKTIGQKLALLSLSIVVLGVFTKPSLAGNPRILALDKTPVRIADPFSCTISSEDSGPLPTFSFGAEKDGTRNLTIDTRSDEGMIQVSCSNSTSNIDCSWKSGLSRLDHYVHINLNQVTEWSDSENQPNYLISGKARYEFPIQTSEASIALGPSPVTCEFDSSGTSIR